MTNHANVARGRNIVARWLVLAEQRLEHLTELLETGRWRRYHSELSFLENLREAKAAVEIWRDLLQGGPGVQRGGLQRQRAKTAAKPPPSHVLISTETGDVAPYKVPSVVPMEDAMAPPLDIEVMAERYPLLRNAL
jgi:uncharacterized repeat protein (TIGR03809 family)